MLPEEFLKWESSARCVDFKPIYVDIAGDVMAGLMLSQIVYSYIDGSDHLVYKAGQYWLPKSMSNWYDELRFSKSNVRTTTRILEQRNLIETRRFKYGRRSIMHIRLNVKTFVMAWRICLNGNEPSHDSNPKIKIQPPGQNRKKEKKSTVKEKVNAERFGPVTSSALFSALNQISENLPQPLSNVSALTRKLERRGETADSVESIWEECQGPGFKSPIGAFLYWIHHNYLPSKKPMSKKPKKEEFDSEPDFAKAFGSETREEILARSKPFEF